MKRALIVVLWLLPLSIVVTASQAHAHGIEIKAVISLDPPEPQPIVHQVTLRLLDAYDNPIAGAQVSVTVGEDPGAPTFALQDAGLDGYRGELRLPSQRTVRVRVQAVLPDGPWIGRFRIRVGTGVRRVEGVGVVLRHGDAPFITPAGAAVAGVMVLSAILALGWTVRDFRSRRRAA